ncbi:MAG: MotA/TolQ/ExbB proton channel family protein [Pseudomonadota bacterium]
MQAFHAVNDFMDQGGAAMYVIAGNAVWLGMLLIERYLYIRFFSRRDQMRLVSEWQRYRLHADAIRIREYLKHCFHLQLAAGVDTVRMLVTVAPLFGLFGTVYGMMEIFDVIALSGTGDARAMAGGISMATLTTMAGMAVAITGLFFQHRIEQLIHRRAIMFNENLEKPCEE